MASAVNQKKGLTTFGWLALGGVAAALLSSKERREKVLNTARDLAGKFTPSSAKKDEGNPAGA
jgi:hypothetical protein